MFLEIALPTPLRRLFDYHVPETLRANTIVPGMRVTVPFGRQTLIGIVIAQKSESAFPKNKIKDILEILDQRSLFSDNLFELLKWSARYYQYPLGEVLHAALPALLRKTSVIAKAGTGLQDNSPPEEGCPKGGVVEIGLFPSPVSGEGARRADEGRGISTTPSRFACPPSSGGEFKNPRWHDKTNLDCSAVMPAQAGIQSPPLLKQSPLVLNTEQQAALHHIQQQSGFHTFLIDGITGSGKTEVYLHLLENLLQEGKQALVLIPEIGLTPQMLSRFEDRFTIPVAIYHSTLTNKARLKTWTEVREGTAKLVIGTRSSIFLPFQNLGGIIIDEEHDQSFKQQEGFRYSARDLAVYRGQQEQIPVILGSATPSLESYYNTQTAKRSPYHWLQLRERAGEAALPQIQLIEMRRAQLQAGMTPELLNAIKQTLDHNQQVLLFLNRRGFSAVFLCHDCGWIATCKRCDAALTLHAMPRRFHCHHCDATQKIMTSCPDCHSEQLIPVGTGTQQLEAKLSELFPDTVVTRIDRDSTRRKGSLQKQLESIHKGEKQILLGTQMLTKGHHFPCVTLVGILNVDNGLFSADFRALEQTAQLIVQVSGRSGRAALPGRVLIQTHHPDHPLLTLLLKQGYTAFLNQLLVERGAAVLPPFAHLALLRAESTQKTAALTFLKWAKEIALQLQGEASLIQCLGPISSAMEKKAGRYRAQLLFRSADRGRLQNLLSQLCQALEENKKSRTVRWSVDVDPQEML